MKSVEYREKALAALTAARDLTDPETGLPTPENEEQFNARMAEFGELDKQRAAAEKTEGNATSATEAWKHYSAALTGEPMRFASAELDPKSRKSLGEQFVESSAYKAVLDQPDLLVQGAKISMSPIVIGQRTRRFGAAATDLIDTESGGSAAYTQYRLPGVLPLRQRPLTIRDLFPNEDMPSGDTIEYVAQVGFDSDAAAVAQATAVNGSGVTGGVKPQSSIRLEERTARATWIATWMAVTRQALSDIPQMRALIDNQGELMINLAEEDQFLNGTGTSPQLIGLLDDDNTGLQTLDLTGLGDLANLEGIRTARRMARLGVGRIPPTFVIVHPIDSEEFDFLKDNEGRYRAGDPFATGGPDSPPIWRLPRVESEAITEGTALVGGRAGATIFDREPLTVRVAEQHSDFFIRNLAVVLFEKRVAFPIYFPGAFVEVTLSEWAPASA
jgi:HK97 family phage major capsid protein